MVAVLQGFGLIAVVVAVGWLLAHTGLFGEAEQRMLAKLTFWVGSPALLFLVISRADVGVVFSGFLVATIAGVVVASAAYMLLARLVWRRSTTDVLMGGMTVAYVNSNNLGVPIAAYVLGDASLAAPMLLFQLLLLQPAWLAALDLAGGGGAGADRRRMLLRPLTNPLTIGSLLGVLAALTGPRLPGAVIDPIELIAGLAIPGMLLAFGISLRLSPRPGSGGPGLSSRSSSCSRGSGTGRTLLTDRVALIRHSAYVIPKSALGRATGAPAHPATRSPYTGADPSVGTTEHRPAVSEEK